MQPVKKESLTNIYYNNWYKNNETFKNPFIFTILPYGKVMDVLASLIGRVPAGTAFLLA